MATQRDENVCLGSTTWEFRKVKIKAPAGRANPSGRRPGRFSGLQRRDPKTRLTISVTYRGGAEAWWLVEARGRSVAFPGHRALHDVMAEINRQYEYMERSD